MHLAYFALLAFLIAEVHYMRGDNIPPPRWIAIRAGIDAPKIVIPTRKPFLAAEEKNRASALNDGVKRRGCTGEATGSRLPKSDQPRTRPWKVWAEGS